MQIKYLPDKDTLIITLNHEKEDSGLLQEEKFMIHQNEAKDPIRIEIYNAGKVVDLDELKVKMPFGGEKEEGFPPWRDFRSAPGG